MRFFFSNYVVVQYFFVYLILYQTIPIYNIIFRLDVNVMLVVLGRNNHTNIHIAANLVSQLTTHNGHSLYLKSFVMFCLFQFSVLFMMFSLNIKTNFDFRMSRKSFNLFVLLLPIIINVLYVSYFLEKTNKFIFQLESHICNSFLFEYVN